jgi:hypothetical protein
MNRDNQQETAIAMGYIAGILDGEGSICLSVCERTQGRSRTLRVTPKVILTNTDMGIIEQCVTCLELLGVSKHIRHARTNNSTFVNATKEVHYIEIFGNSRVKALLEQIAPFLGGTKRERAELIMRFVSRRIAKAEDRGVQVNYKYDREDIENIMSFFNVTRSKNLDHYSRLLNDYMREAA